MADLLTALLALAIPGLYLAAAAYVRLAPLAHPGRSAGPAIAAGAAGLGLAVLLVVITAMAGSQTYGVRLGEGVAPSFRFDWVSLPILSLVTFVGFVVLRFSRNYLDGDARSTHVISSLARRHRGADHGWRSHRLRRRLDDAQPRPPQAPGLLCEPAARGAGGTEEVYRGAPFGSLILTAFVLLWWRRRVRPTSYLSAAPRQRARSAMQACSPRFSSLWRR